MTQNKKVYSQPLADLLVVRFEQNIMSGEQNGVSSSSVDNNLLDLDWD